MFKIKQMITLFLMSLSFSLYSNSSSDLASSPESTYQCPVTHKDDKGILESAKASTQQAWDTTKTWVSKVWNSTKEGARNFSDKVRSWWHSRSDSKDKVEVNAQ